MLIGSCVLYKLSLFRIKWNVGLNNTSEHLFIMNHHNQHGGKLEYNWKVNNPLGPNAKIKQPILHVCSLD